MPGCRPAFGVKRVSVVCLVLVAPGICTVFAMLGPFCFIFTPMLALLV